jgi:ABC-2 type transport system permease protein
VFYLCRGFFNGAPTPEVMLAFALSLVMSFLLGFFLEAAIGMIGFWFLEVSSLLFVYMLFNFFFSGHMFPIDMLPRGIAKLVQLLPLQYLAYFPSAVFLGKIQGADLVAGLWLQAAWLLFFVLLCRGTLYLGLKRYSAYGG